MSSSSSSDAASRLGQIVGGKYRLDEVIGRGGMGAVYRATHVGVMRQFAVKLLHKEAREHKDVVRRFFLEAQVAAKIGHPGIADVYDVGEESDGTPFMAMELLAGEPLSARLTRGPIAVREAVDIALQVLAPLEAAHRAGVVHRDIKPHNIFLIDASSPSASANGGRIVKLLDFGIAKLAEGAGPGSASAMTRSGVLIGSPLYMSPEQVRAEPDVDVRADVWSVGCVLYEMIVGKPPHAAPTTIAVLAKIAMDPVAPPSTACAGVPEAVDRIVARALTIDRAGRYASVDDMRAALEAFRDGTSDTLVSAPVGVPSLHARSPETLHATREPEPGTATTASVPPVANTSNAGADSLPGATSTPSPSPGVTSRRRRAVLVGGAAIGTLVVGSVAWTSLYAHRVPAVGDGRVGASGQAPSERNAGYDDGNDHAETAAHDASTPQAEGSVSASVSVVSSAPPSLGTGKSDAGAHADRPHHTGVPTCPANEAISEGHCCAYGLVWQVDRCDRPLATKTPF